jgi:hypothetical protein
MLSPEVKELFDEAIKMALPVMLVIGRKLKNDLNEFFKLHRKTQQVVRRLAMERWGIDPFDPNAVAARGDGCAWAQTPIPAPSAAPAASAAAASTAAHSSATPTPPDPSPPSTTPLPR